MPYFFSQNRSHSHSEMGKWVRNERIVRLASTNIINHFTEIFAE